MAKTKKNDKCDVVFRVPVHSSVKIGEVSIGKCENDAAPGLTCCWDHANKDTLIHYIKMLLKENKELKERQ